MPFFNFRRGGPPSANAAPASQPESVEVIRKRARHRLIGAAVLVLAGVVGFPLLFDTQPRPVAIDIPIEIPGKTTVKPLALPSRDAASAPVAAATPATAAVAPASAAAAARVAAASSLTPREEIVTERPVAAPTPATPPKPAVVASAPARPAPAASTPAKPPLPPKPEVKPAPKPAAADDGARAKALLDGKPPAAATAAEEGRMVVQVGAFSDVVKAREARLKLEKAGLKTYTQVAETKDGRRIRVRVGPFATRAEAEKAASKIKTLDLPAAILTL
jgi:DedD protein